jgi:hypothetical protein
MEKFWAVVGFFKNNKINKTMEDFGKFCLLIIGAVILVLFGGYVFMTLWDWFIVTTFGAKALNLPQAIGISLIVSYLKAKTKRDKDEKLDIEKISYDFFYSLVASAFILGIGWFVTLFL